MILDALMRSLVTHKVHHSSNDVRAKSRDEFISDVVSYFLKYFSKQGDIAGKLGSPQVLIYESPSTETSQRDVRLLDVRAPAQL